MDMSKLSTAELEAIAAGDMSKVSDTTLKLIVQDGGDIPAADPAAPLNASLDTAESMTPINPADSSKPNLLKDMAVNAIPSALEYGKNLVNMVAHPVDTANAIGTLAHGATVGNLLDKWGMPSETKPMADQFWQVLKDRYGGMDQLENTLRKDPVGALADMSTAFTGAGGALKLGSMVPKMGKAATFADLALKAGKMTDPLSIASATVGKAAPYVGNAAAQVLGKTTTVGGEAIKKAFKADPAFAEAMRGNTTTHDLATAAKAEIEQYRQMRGDEYRKALENVENSTAQLDLNPVLFEFDKQRRKFGVGRDAQGELVFTHKTQLDSSAWDDFKRVDDLMKEWAKDTGSRSALDFDGLKRRLDSFYSPDGNFRAALTPVRQKVKGQLVDAVDGYADMTKAYDEATTMLDELNATLSTNSKMGDTTVRKLISTNRDGFDRRNDILTQLTEKTGGKDVGSMAAGFAMQPVIPRGLTPYILGGGAVARGTADPITAAIVGSLALSSSPRVVGEAVYKLGQGRNLAGPTIEKLRMMGLQRGLTPASRIKEKTDGRN